MKGQCAAASLSDCSLLPREVDVALILRHAQREDIPPGSFGEDIHLTEQGVRAAERFGKLLPARMPGKLASSPISRCVETALAICRGAGWSTSVTTDWRLGVHGTFVSEPEVSGELFLEVGVAELVRRQLHDPQPPPGMRDIAEGARTLLDFASEGLEDRGRINVYVTHDAILAALVGWLFRLPVYEEGWPDFLDGLLLWRSGSLLHCAWSRLHQATYPLRR